MAETRSTTKPHTNDLSDLRAVITDPVERLLLPGRTPGRANTHDFNL